VKKICDGNSAATKIAYALSEVAAIFPITPASSMGELADQWSAEGKENIFGQKVTVSELQSEAGAAGAVHGALSAGALTTTFTASQGLLLMLPNMHKIAGELLPTVFHVAARSLASQSLSIFGDHSDVMSARNTGFGMISSSNVQEAQDLALIAHLVSLDTEIPFLHFFDGFRTSHEIQKIEDIDLKTINSMVDYEAIKRFRNKKLTPEKPIVKVGAENPDVYFQGRETVNKYYEAIPASIKKYTKLLKEKTGRSYEPYEYFGAKDATKIIVAMGSSTDTIKEVTGYLNKKNKKVGTIAVKLYRPFLQKEFLKKIPKTVKQIVVLDRTKEPGSVGEPLYLDVATTISSSNFCGIKVIGGRYGLSSKEFTPSMANAVFDYAEKGTHDFTVGINDDLTNKSIPINKKIILEKDELVCKFWGYGSDGTVSASKNALKIIGTNSEKFVQGYFEYDSRKSGGVTQTYLKISDKEINAPYLPQQFNCIILNHNSYVRRYDILNGIKENGTFLLNCPWGKEKAFSKLTKEMQNTIIKNKINFYVIDAEKIAEDAGIQGKINNIVLNAFFKLMKPIKKDATELIKQEIKKQFGKQNPKIVERNFTALKNSEKSLEKVKIVKIKENVKKISLKLDKQDMFSQKVLKPISELKGDSIPVSAMPHDGSIPLGATKLEKRRIASHVIKWNPEKCIQCGKCSLVCPHAAIRTKQITKKDLKNAPKTFNVIKSNTKNDKELQFKVQNYCDDCTGCGNCVDACPTNALELIPINESLENGEKENYEFFDKLEHISDGAVTNTIKATQFKKPLFEFSGACAGCGETPYIKLLTQLFGDRMIIANATGCSSIYGGTFPFTPYTKNLIGKGPAWANSLFEDNAEYGFGMRLATETLRERLKQKIELLMKESKDSKLNKLLKNVLISWNKKTVEADEEIKKLILFIETIPKNKQTLLLKEITELKDFLREKSNWIIGGDGWAYDIGYGGLDHVAAQGKNVNMLILDNELYANTGGQASKATPRSAVAKFAMAGKQTEKKDLGRMMMTYGNVFVASINMGANPQHAITAIIEAEKYEGTSIIIAYSPCINHGYNLRKAGEHSKNATSSGYWPIYTFNPSNEKPLTLLTREAKTKFEEYISTESRYSSLKLLNKKHFAELYSSAEKDSLRRLEELKKLE